MNDKFKQLALEAKMGTADFDAGSYYVATPDRMQLFAELIVRECAQVCIEEGKTFEVESAGEYSSNLYATAIRKHFGVEQ
jgi:hypothetical protein